MIKVFISYAWENDEFRNSIWELAGWLEKNSDQRVKVITDHLFSNAPPLEGWPLWMQNQISEADKVLSVCSPKYIKYFEKDSDSAKGGFGVTHEGLIITQIFYNGKGKNEKFFPICPDGGALQHIPLILKAYDNGHCFPSNNDKILLMILGENPSHQTSNLEPVELIALENLISEEIIEVEEKIENHMDFDIQVLIRAYLSLSNTNKLIVISLVDSDQSYLKDLGEFDRDKTFMEANKDSDSLKKIWDSINQIKPFDNPLNPF